MAEDERLNMQIKKELVLRLKEAAVKMTKGKGSMVTMQGLADKAVSEYLKKIERRK